MRPCAPLFVERTSDEGPSDDAPFLDDGGPVRGPREAPGIGVEVDEHRIEQLTVRREEVS